MLTYDDMHKLFCPFATWEQYRMSCETQEAKEEWLEQFLSYCKACRIEARKTLREYAFKSDRERRESKIFKYESI